ncbi:kinase-like domain-containing protein [Glomus cerebriforme]|uniref:Kinase-like domain-containing protein n=1 Tax=Glomus cerebriforme TaxID=658196 RepID=A0A397SXS4_9GLOM|nr:kinase-like domain-containing protein [Glomus cerebriforme]
MLNLYVQEGTYKESMNEEPSPQLKLIYTIQGAPYKETVNKTPHKTLNAPFSLIYNHVQDNPHKTLNELPSTPPSKLNFNVQETQNLDTKQANLLIYNMQEDIPYEDVLSEQTPPKLNFSALAIYNDENNTLLFSPSSSLDFGVKSSDNMRKGELTAKNSGSDKRAKILNNLEKEIMSISRISTSNKLKFKTNEKPKAVAIEEVIIPDIDDMTSSNMDQNYKIINNPPLTNRIITESCVTPSNKDIISINNSPCVIVSSPTNSDQVNSSSDSEYWTAPSSPMLQEFINVPRTPINRISTSTDLEYWTAPNSPALSNQLQPPSEKCKIALRSLVNNDQTNDVSLSSAYFDSPTLQRKRSEVAVKRRFNQFAETLYELKNEESPESSPKKCRADFSLSEQFLTKRHLEDLEDDKALTDLSGCKKRRQLNLDRDERNDMIDEFFMSSPTIMKFTSSTIPFKPVENYHDKATGFMNKFTTSFAHLLSKEYFDRTTFEDRQIFIPERLSNEIYFDEEFVNKEKLGEGEFSEVYKCVVKKTGNSCVVKRSKAPFKGPLNRQDRLEEVEIHYKVGKHRNIVELISAWEQRGHLYLQTELCEKGSLAALINERKKSDKIFSEEEIWQIISDIKSAFTHLHEKSIIHLDVKPENILIKQVNYRNIYKLVDFGCATSIPPRKDFDKDGDRRYLSNDALNGIYSPGADWFSFGITVLELTTLRRMEDNGDIYQRLRRGNLTDYKEQLLSYSEKLEKAIVVMLSHNPEERCVDSSFGV